MGLLGTFDNFLIISSLERSLPKVVCQKHQQIKVENEEALLSTKSRRPPDLILAAWLTNGRPYFARARFCYCYRVVDVPARYPAFSALIFVDDSPKLTK